MEKDLSVNPDDTLFPVDTEKTDAAAKESVRAIVLVFARAVSALKIYPSHHLTVRTIREELSRNLLKYLEDHDDLEITVEENSFSFSGQPVYHEEKIPRSLPFLFFKDGMRKLTFLRGLNPEELAEFLEIVRENALMPTVQSDIVDALWERDFEFIRYFAPDEFLETKIAAKEDILEDLRVDKESLQAGRIELTDEDREEIFPQGYALGIKEGQENPELDNLVTTLEGKDDEALKALLETERGFSAEEEFLDLLFELLLLEDRVDSFFKILTFIEKHHLGLVRARDFVHAVRLLDHLGDLRDLLAESCAGRTKALDDFMSGVTERVPLESLEETLKFLRLEDLPVFIDYLKRIGPRALKFGALIFEAYPEPDIRALASDFLRQTGLADVALLAGLATERNLELTGTIISILGSAGDKKVVPLLASFLAYQNPDIKIEAIRALAHFGDDLAAKIKIEFFRDPDERVRTAAAAGLDPRADPRALEVLLAAARETKSLHKKSLAEKEAILAGLGASRAPEAVETLRTILMKRKLFAGSRVDQTRLAAVANLKSLGTAAALEALEKGQRSRGRRVRDACRRAIADMPFWETET